jgi:hypothetical protein
MRFPGIFEDGRGVQRCEFVCNEILKFRKLWMFGLAEQEPEVLWGNGLHNGIQDIELV